MSTTNSFTTGSSLFLSVLYIFDFLPETDNIYIYDIRIKKQQNKPKQKTGVWGAKINKCVLGGGGGGIHVLMGGGGCKNK